MKIKLAESDAELEHCFPIMVQLRPHLNLSHFKEQVTYQIQHENYRLAYVDDSDRVCAVGGFRIINMLARGRFLYVDDLVTDEKVRSHGYGDALLDWLVDYAKTNACQHFELDSGVQRTEAHRFYFRKRMVITAYHFSLPL
ncbi:MAG TPA: GNAT family N-acetyltransferase [Crinalium sp.]|jgi:GNAT superfamily N-acetyltransferase